MKEVILSTVKNMYGEEVVDKALLIYPEEGKFLVEELNCYSSIDLGLGTCKCVSHPLWDDYEVTGSEARKLVNKAYKKGLLSERELQEILGLIDKTEMIAFQLKKQKEDFYCKNPIQLLLDHFGIETQEELENHIFSCYKLNINPLPSLRKVLKEYGWDIRYYAIDNGWNVVEPVGKVIACCVYWEDNDPIDVKLIQGTDEIKDETKSSEDVDFVPDVE